MTETYPNCPRCHSSYTYLDEGNFVCPECGHDWQNAVIEEDEIEMIKDAHGHVLKDGDSVAIIKDLKIKGSSAVLKVGTKVKSIRLVGGDHPIDCKIDGFGPIKLKSEFVKKI